MINAEIKKVVNRVKEAQKKLQSTLQSQDWLEEAKKYAEKQRVEVLKLIESDGAKVKTFIERERKELERFQKQIPGEVKKFKALIQAQRTELEKLLKSVRQANAKASKGANKKKKVSTGTKTRKKTGASKSTAST